MIVIFGSAFDRSLLSLVERWKTHDARLMTCADLSSPGWRHFLGSKTRSRSVVHGRTVRNDSIQGVLIRWPGVFPQELPHIIAADREYVAQEMTAFLVSWLSSLDPRRHNR